MNIDAFSSVHQTNFSLSDIDGLPNNLMDSISLKMYATALYKELREILESDEIDIDRYISLTEEFLQKIEKQDPDGSFSSMMKDYLSIAYYETEQTDKIELSSSSSLAKVYIETKKGTFAPQEYYEALSYLDSMTKDCNPDQMLSDGLLVMALLHKIMDNSEKAVEFRDYAEHSRREFEETQLYCDSAVLNSRGADSGIIFFVCTFFVRDIAQRIVANSI